MKKKKKTANKYFSLLVLARLSLSRILYRPRDARVCSDSEGASSTSPREFYDTYLLLHTISLLLLLLLLLLRSAALKVYIYTKVRVCTDAAAGT